MSSCLPPLEDVSSGPRPLVDVSSGLRPPVPPGAPPPGLQRPGSDRSAGRDCPATETTAYPPPATEK